ncbi:MAG: TonB-dependent receptor [Cyclobacteriaceae bacterium]|nr:TonB-dependent receptor [Cyclobacteriaceae bacterium]
MIAKLKTIVFGVCAFASLHVSAQQKDSVRLLQNVIIEQSRLNNYSTSQYALPVDSMTRALSSSGSLADMLRKFGYGHIRSYGPGGLATASLRGTGSNHTAILWNGINIISPLSGQSDLSLVPVGFIDELSVQSGGSAGLYGNGSIGGTIQLNNKASFNSGLTLKTFANVGSFGNYYQDFGVSWSGKKFITSTKVFTSQAKNDFEYLNKNFFPERIDRRIHSGFDQKGILQQNYWQISSQHLLTFKLWYQDNLYEVPNATFTSKPAEATERDQFYRALLGWNFTKNSFDLNYQGAFVHYDLNYQDPVTDLISPSVFDTFINNLEANFSFSKGASLTTGANYTFEQGKVDAFGGLNPVRNRIAVFGAYKWKGGTRWEFITSIRNEIINSTTTPLAPSLTAKYKTKKGIEVYGNVSRNYRIPTFNDLYWRSGALGNPDLQTEISLGGEAGLNFSSHQTYASDVLWTFKTAVFSNHVDNWIQWIPGAGGIYSPHNIKKVWSRGIETQTSISKRLGKVDVMISGHYSFTQATNQSVYEANTNELDKQLILTPLHEASGTVRIIWNKFYLNIIDNFTGTQFTDSDNSNTFAMSSYNILNTSLSKPFQVKKIKTTLSGEWNNIFNVDYQARPGYPLPRTNFKIGVTIHFTKPNSI